MSQSPVCTPIDRLAESRQLVIVIGACLMFAAMTAWLVFLLMLLKSFIWNLYQAVLVTILTEAELTEQEDGRDN
ncbi:hypothetical protein C3E99_03390 [Sphingopyxis sp. MG]|nr:hypothetical protein C3E99_03390 [Sphingopyxis sp. MG]